ncbi:hypothetical protein CY34DRAFT_809167, partial [Suillus luteus UH-Slu-Lm8-n1]
MIQQALVRDKNSLKLTRTVLTPRRLCGLSASRQKACRINPCYNPSRFQNGNKTDYQV